MFGNSLRGVYESVVFLFIVHPFDVGDTIAVGPGVAAGSGERCVVEEIALLTSTLRRVGDGAAVAWPNAALAAGPLVNMSRSGPRCEVMKVLVDAGALVAAAGGEGGRAAGLPPPPPPPPPPPCPCWRRSRRPRPPSWRPPRSTLGATWLSLSLPARARAGGPWAPSWR